MKNLHLHTDIGHDPDDVIALCYLIENGFIPTSISITPGYGVQYDIVHKIFKEYDLQSPPIYCSKLPTILPSEKEIKYQPGPHKVFCSNEDRIIFRTMITRIECDVALVIGPALNLGGNLKANRMVFQGGYSPNSINPLEKFKGQMSAQSFNPSGAKKDFISLRDTEDIVMRRYVGKNVCHGYKKEDIEFSPTPKLLRGFFNGLSSSKAMHDVLAARMLLNEEEGVWENKEPYFTQGLQISVQDTTKDTKVLIGIR